MRDIRLQQILPITLFKIKIYHLEKHIKISARLVNYAENKNKKLNELNLNEIKKVKKDLDKSVMRVFDVKNSVNSKTSYGGTSIKSIKKMLLKLKKEFK